MNIKREFKYAVLKDLDTKVLEMTYVNSDLISLKWSWNFMIILPNIDNRLKSHDLSLIASQMSSDEIDVTIPKFKAEFRIKLEEKLFANCLIVFMKSVIWFLLVSD